MKKQFILIFSLTFFLIILVGSCSFLAEVSSIDQTPLTEQPSEKAEKENEQIEEPAQSPPVSYNFVGKFDGISDEPAEQQDTREELQVEDNAEKDGKIPELTIELNGQNIHDIAKHYGYVLTLMTKDKILGTIKNGELNQVDQHFLSNFANRARAAEISTDIEPIIKRLQQHLDQPIKAVYLVPNQIEEQFIQIQLQAIREVGLTPDEVNLVTAKYLSDYSIEVIDIES